MGKRTISQARGKGSLTYRVRRKAFLHKIKYPMKEGEALIVNLIHSPGHSAPLIHLLIKDEAFYNPAFNNAYIGQKITIGKSDASPGNIISLKNIPSGTLIYNIEKNPGDGGLMKRAAGTSATVYKKLENNKVSLLMGKKKEIILSGDCRATVGIVAGAGRKLKPMIKAGVAFYKRKATSKLYPRTSAVKMNAIDHPFGSGRGKRPKSKIAKRNSPRGRRVGLLRPKRTGRKKR
jgi:large subunit ribosomal protein L2